MRLQQSYPQDARYWFQIKAPANVCLCQRHAVPLPVIHRVFVIFETHQLSDEEQRNPSGCAISVFGQYQIGLASIGLFVLGGFRIIARPVKQAHHVGIVLNGTRITEIRHPRNAKKVAIAAFRFAVELRENQNRNANFLGQTFDARGDIGNFPFVGLLCLWRIRFEELKVVDGNEADVIL